MNPYGYQPGAAEIAESRWWNTEAGEVGLPHSCDDWCIGDADNVRAMIKDLQALLTVLEQSDPVASPRQGSANA